MKDGFAKELKARLHMLDYNIVVEALPQAYVLLILEFIKTSPFFEPYIIIELIAKLLIAT